MKMRKSNTSANPVSILESRVKTFLKPRPKDSHKGMFGTALVIGGEKGMVGAPLLAARAALKMGAGRVHVALLAENSPLVDVIQPELMLHEAAAGLRQFNPEVIAIGCGMGNSKLAYKLLYESMKQAMPVVLDADALNLIASHSELQEDLRERLAPTVITPHPGEAARLLGCDMGEIQADRVAAAKQLAERYKCSVVLKGAESICITGSNEIFINRTGNPGMSSAGMGDVLTGMIAAFIAQGMKPDQAILLAVYLHGAAGDEINKQGISTGMTASDVTEWARWLLNKLTTPSS